MQKPWKKTMIALLVGAASGLFLVIVGLIGYVGVITHQIDQKMDQLHSSRGSEFYALYPAFKKGQKIRFKELRSLLQDQGFVEKRGADGISPGEYAVEHSGSDTLLYLDRPAFNGAGHAVERTRAKLTFSEAEGILTLNEIRLQESSDTVESFENLPKKVAAYFAGRLRMQNSVPLSDMPVSVRMAVMAIEDVNFLEHVGVSFRGTLRALWKDLRALKFVEGGSTLTQQLMKNLFFSREKALSRKLKEALFALVTEGRHSKEEILEAYLNEVYMGQWGTHEIHGVSEGARYYFNRPISELNLAQSATLAAIIQAPNAQDPFRFPERTLKRRNLVLKRMFDAQFILDGEYQIATEEPLGVSSAGKSLADIDYFIELAVARLPADVSKRMEKEALTIYVTLNPYLQGVASQVLSSNIERLQKTYAELQRKEKKGSHLQGALVAIDVKNCQVLALQGGRSYRQTQFNRVTQGKRQPGSLIKPFVFLSGFLDHALNPPLTPTLEIEDSPFEWKYEGQSWSPRNYDKEFRGLVTARQALELSLNVPTARLAERVGLAAIVDSIHKAGISAPIPKVPSIILGSAEVTPLELAESFTTFANLGKACELNAYSEIYDENHNLISKNQVAQHEVFPPTPVFETVSLMKGVFTHGSARSALGSGINVSHFAGKTGTTNDAKDAWFLGFSSQILVLVWVGYDEEEKVGLAGSSAALPIWVDFMKGAGSLWTEEDFIVPDGLSSVIVDRGKTGANGICVDPQVEYFPSGLEPKTQCTPAH